MKAGQGDVDAAMQSTQFMLSVLAETRGVEEGGACVIHGIITQIQPWDITTRFIIGNCLFIYVVIVFCCNFCQ